MKANITDGTISSKENKEYTTDDGLYMYIDSNDAFDHYTLSDKKSVLGESDKKAENSTWTIEFKDKDGNTRTDVKAIAQTYCVYDGTVSVPDNRDVPTDLTD